MNVKILKVLLPTPPPPLASGLEEQVLLMGKEMMRKRGLGSIMRRQSTCHLSDLFFRDLGSIWRMLFKISWEGVRKKICLKSLLGGDNNKEKVVKH